MLPEGALYDEPVQAHYPYCSIKPIGVEAQGSGSAVVWRGNTDIAADDGRGRWSGVAAWWGWRRARGVPVAAADGRNPRPPERCTSWPDLRRAPGSDNAA